MISSISGRWCDTGDGIRTSQATVRVMLLNMIQSCRIKEMIDLALIQLIVKVGDFPEHAKPALENTELMHQKWQIQQWAW